MYTLHHCVGARSFRVLWMLEELGADYVLKMLPFPPRAGAREFLQVNPLGTVPAFMDDGAGRNEGGAIRMTESAAICQYLAARAAPTALDVQPREHDFGTYLNYLHFGEATLTFPQTLVLRYGRFEPAERRSPQVAADYAKWFLARLRTLEPLLSARDHLCGRFTAADVSVGYALLLAGHLDLAGKFTPAVAAYWQRLREREAFRRALQVEERSAREQGVSTVPAPDTPAPEPGPIPPNSP